MRPGQNRAVESAPRGVFVVGVCLLLAGVMLIPSLAAGIPEERRSSAPAGADMSLVPSPTLETLEDGVRNQLTGLRQAVERLIATGTYSVREQGEALGRLGALYLLYDFNRAAEACLVQARLLQPDDFRSSYYLGALYTLDGEAEKAQQALAAALALEPNDVPARIRQGDLFLEQADLEGAETSFRSVLESAAGSAAARFGLGRVAFSRGQYAASIPHFEAVLKGAAEGSVAHHFLGMAYRHLGDLERARRHLGLSEHLPVPFADPLMEELQSLNVSRETFFSMGVEAMRRGEPERGLEAFQRALAAQPDDPETHYNVGMAYLEMGESEQAEAHLRKATQLRPTYRDASFNLGVLLARRGEDREAARYFERAAEIDPEDLRAQVRWADSLARIGEEEAAIRKLEEVLEIDPAMVPARLVFATVLARIGRRPAAEENFGRILALAPGAVSARSEVHYRLATLDPAPPGARVIDHLRSAVELDPDFLEAHRALAEELGRLGRYAEAARQSARVIELEPKDPHAHFGQAMALILGGFYRQARSGLEQSLTDLPSSLPLAHALARLLATCPDPEVREGSRALELARSVAEQELTLDHAETVAMAWAEVGRFDEAIRWQRRVLSQEQSVLGSTSSRRRERLDLYERGEPVRAPWLDP